MKTKTLSLKVSKDIGTVSAETIASNEAKAIMTLAHGAGAGGDHHRDQGHRHVQPDGDDQPHRLSHHHRHAEGHVRPSAQIRSGAPDARAGRLEREVDLFLDSGDLFDRLHQAHAARSELFVGERRIVGHIGELLVFGPAP